MTLEFVSHTDYLLALLPEAILIAAALVLLLVDAFTRGPGERARPWIGPVAAVSVLPALAANAWLFGVEAGPNGLVAVDGLRLAANFIVLGATFLGLLFSFDYLDREGLRAGEFHVLILFSAVGMMTLVAARDLILVFLGLELMSIPVYALTGFDRRSPRSAEAGLKYFLIGAFASAFFLYGIALVYGATGTTHLAGVSAAAQGAASGPLLAAGVGFLVVGFGFKISAVPFHMWTPDAYEGAPTPVTGFMAAGVKAAGFVALLRVITVELAPAADVWGVALWWLALLTMIVPNLIALAQENVKRMLAYSSIAHAGYLLVGVVTGTALGQVASLFYLAVYALMTLGAFAIVYHVAGEGEQRLHLTDFRGLGWRRPLLGLALALFLVSLAGFPPTGGFVGKVFLLRAAVDADQVALAVTLVVTSLVSYYYYFRVVWKMYFEEPEEAPSPGVPGRGFRLAAVACAAGVLVAGVFPGPALDRLERAGALPPASAAGAPAPASPLPASAPEPSASPGEEPASRTAPGREAASTPEAPGSPGAAP